MGEKQNHVPEWGGLLGVFFFSIFSLILSLSFPLHLELTLVGFAGLGMARTIVKMR